MTMSAEASLGRDGLGRALHDGGSGRPLGQHLAHAGIGLDRPDLEAPGHQAGGSAHRVPAPNSTTWLAPSGTSQSRAASGGPGR